MSKYCRECGNEINEKAVICPKCGCATGVNNAMLNNGKSKVVAVLLWLFLGGVGGHHFYVGNVNRALIYIATTFILTPLLFGIPLIFLGIAEFIDLYDICKGNLKGVELN